MGGYWGVATVTFMGVGKKQAVRGSSSDLGYMYMYMIRGSRKKLRGGGESLYRINHPPSLLDPSMYIMSGAVNFNTILHVFKQ